MVVVEVVVVVAVAVAVAVVVAAAVVVVVANHPHDHRNHQRRRKHPHLKFTIFFYQMHVDAWLVVKREILILKNLSKCGSQHLRSRTDREPYRSIRKSPKQNSSQQNISPSSTTWYGAA